MDCGSADNAPGVDPNFLSSWDFNNTFSDLTWDQNALDNLPELDSYQDSNEGDAELFDFLSAQGPPSRDSLDPSVIDATSIDLSNAPVGVADGVNFVGGTFSPRTHPSADDNSFPDNAWSQFQLSHTNGLVMPMDPVYSNQYSKAALGPNAPVIVGEGERGMDTGLTGYQRARSLSAYQQLRQSVSYNNNNNSNNSNNKHNGWRNSISYTASFGPTQFPISPPLEAQSENPMSGTATNHQWFPSTDMSVGTKLTDAFATMSHDVSVYSRSQPVKPEPQTGASSPSIHSTGGVAVSIDSYSSMANNDLPLYAENDVKDEQLHVLEWEEPVSPDKSLESSPEFPKINGFMVSEDTSDIPQMSLEQERRNPTSSRHTHSALQPASVARRRKQRNSSVVNIDKIQQPRPLQIVQEDGLGGAISSEDFVCPPRGARRKGPLTIVGRANAGLRRKNKDTCVQCRLNKRKCDGNSPCDACRPTLQEQPCARACFASIVEYGTCNYISQRAINHPTSTSGEQRIRIEIPSAFDLQELLTYLGERRGKFNIRASQSWGSLYVLDLGETYKFLKNLSEYNDNSQSTFLEFIDHRVIDSKDKTKNWLSCVKDCDPMNNVYKLLSQWNNMPSRASYSFVSLDGNANEKMMDVSNNQDRRDILLAAQLSRIFCRLLEVEGFRKLERDFYNIKWKRISLDAHLRFLEELGHILLSLRWRVSWWKRLGDGGKQPDPGQQHYIDRVELLCRILYVYYTSVLTKLPAWSATDNLKGKWSRYADTEKEIWDDFPENPTEAGFQRWMEHGRELIEEAGSPIRVTMISKA
ncbi:conserved hypothetical protein [Talaromyces stipitatus ATCC 10500]|uniref:Zn(2)-C6 fungal-type domain-containing protein n=1 Tax=Talaromyces stipitatus (strain ATCC 10500 / CBS 375.48 / QM 6759 / NRRL 1006) TaxID=441959 RepID=B8MFE7_TALSN|nr:uncharacterized protein TSTA_017560 [Talaromyces stipitatus ATCC 10500]EED16681.1 conserved hypothetical protein [Talaromyces stipitatus ATCC 10500]